MSDTEFIGVESVSIHPRQWIADRLAAGSVIPDPEENEDYYLVVGGALADKYEPGAVLVVCDAMVLVLPSDDDPDGLRAEAVRERHL